MTGSTLVSTRSNRLAGKVRKRSDRDCRRTGVGAVQSSPSRSSSRCSSATPPIWRQTMLRTSATMTGSTLVSTRSRRPSARYWSSWASVAGWINSASRSVTASAGGAAGGRLLRSRWIARVWRTLLPFFRGAFPSACGGSCATRSSLVNRVIFTPYSTDRPPSRAALPACLTLTLSCLTCVQWVQLTTHHSSLMTHHS